MAKVQVAEKPAPAKKAGKPNTLKEVTAAGADDGSKKGSATDALLASGQPLFPCRELKGLKLYKENARIHSKEQIAELAHAMVEFGYTQPVLLDDKGLIAGHGRVAAVKLCYEQGHVLKFAGTGAPIPVGSIPFIDITGMTKPKREALIIWDNKSALKATWDVTMLAVKLEELNALGELTLTGFDTGELDTLLVEMKETTFLPSEQPMTTSKPVTAEAMAKGHIKLNEKYDDAAQQDLVNVMCPHCAKEFQIDKPA